MDELTLLRQLRADIDQASTGPDAAALLRARHRLLVKTDSPPAEPTSLPPDVTPLHPQAHPTRRTPATRWAPVLAVAAVVAILAVGAGVVAVHRSRTTVPATSSYAGGPVPWSAAGGHPTTESAPLPAVAGAPPGTRGCVSDDFRLVSGSSKPGPGSSGWMITTYTLVSVASSPCASWELSAGLDDSRGVPLPVDGVPQGGDMPRFDGPPRVDPGDLVTGTVTWAVVRGATNPPADLVILPDYPGMAPRKRPPLAISLAGVTIPPNPQNPNSGGGGPYTWRSTSYGNAITVSQPGSLASLTATVTAPDTVRLGQVLAYAVELKNPTNDPVSLERCPEVIQVLSVVPQKEPISSGFRGPLNCAAAPGSIPPGGAVDFRMEVATHGLVPGSGYFTWQLASNGSVVSDLRAQITVLP